MVNTNFRSHQYICAKNCPAVLGAQVPPERTHPTGLIWTCHLRSVSLAGYSVVNCSFCSQRKVPSLKPWMVKLLRKLEAKIHRSMSLTPRHSLTKKSSGAGNPMTTDLSSGFLKRVQMFSITFMTEFLECFYATNFVITSYKKLIY